MTKKSSNIVNLKEVYQEKLNQQRSKLTALNLKDLDKKLPSKTNIEEIFVSEKVDLKKLEDSPKEIIPKVQSEQDLSEPSEDYSGMNQFDSNFEIDLDYDINFNLDLSQDFTQDESQNVIIDQVTKPSVFEEELVININEENIQKPEIQVPILNHQNLIPKKTNYLNYFKDLDLIKNISTQLQKQLNEFKNDVIYKNKNLSFIPKDSKYNFTLKSNLETKPSFVFSDFIDYIKNLTFLYPENKKIVISFLSVAILTGLAFPSFKLMYAGFTVKDNINLQIAASKELFTRTNDNTDLYLTQNLLALSNGLDKTSNDIDLLQGNLSGIIGLLPILSSVNAGEEVSTDLAKIASLSAELSIAIKPFLDDNFDMFDMKNTAITMDSIKKTKYISKQINEELISLEKHISKINTSILPKSSVDEIIKTKKALPVIINLTSETDKYFDLLLKFIGEDREKNYLFIFQNNQELRPTGGFIGSYGLVKLDRGIIKKLDIREIYSADGQLSKQILSPTPLQELTKRWFFRDSNWFADFTLSSNKMMQFYEQSGGISTEGVLSITPTIIERILKITGPITLEKYNTTISSENFIEMTQFQTVQENALVYNKPKQFLADLAPILLKKIISLEIPKLIEVSEVIKQGIKERLIIANFKDQELQNFIQDINMTGELYDTSKDYLSVVNTNLGGYKTDGVIDNNIKLETKISDNGSIINKVTVKRTHNGGDKEYEWWNLPNINYLRLYVPKGSKIIKAEGFEKRDKMDLPDYAKEYNKDKDLEKIFESEKIIEEFNLTESIESGKTVFGGWKTTATKQSSEISIEYELPFKLKKKDLYSVILQKQAGDIRTKYTQSVLLDPSIKLSWKKSADEISINKNNISIKENLFNTDKFLALELNRK